MNAEVLLFKILLPHICLAKFWKVIALVLPIPVRSDALVADFLF